MKSLLIQTILPLAGATLLATGLLVGCKDISYPDPTPTSSPSTALAKFNFVNVSPDAPAVNFFIENAQVTAGQAISTTPLTASYVNGQAGGGGVELRAKAASGGIGGVIGSSDVLYRASATNNNNFAAVAGNSYTVFLTDSLNRPKPVVVNGTNLGGPQFFIVTDTLTAPVAGRARVRFFNFAPDVSAASARLTNTISSTTTATLNNRMYRTTNATSLGYTSLPAGAYVTQVYTATAAQPTSSTVAPTLSTTLTLADGKIYTIYTQGLRRANKLSIGSIQHN